MDNYNVEYIEQKLFEIIISKIKDNFNNHECLKFNVNDLAEQLQIKSDVL